MADAEAESLTGSPGARLAVARTQAGLSTAEVAERLHLTEATLEALESGRLEGLGASVYARGHLRRYAELVRVPEEEIMAAYEAWSGRLAALPDLRHVITAPAVRSGSRRFELHPRHALIGAIVLVLAALVWWAMRKAPRVTASVPPPSTRTVVAKAAEAPKPRAEAPPSTPPASPAAAPSVAATSEAGSAPPVHAPAAAVPTSASVPSGQVRLALSFSDDSWAEIYGANGTQLFHGLARAGSQHHVMGSAPMRIFLGNPAVVTLELNGKALMFTGKPNARPRRFSLDTSGLVVDAPGPQPKAD
jgi:cytoskeleton protein RodZ